LFVLSHTYKIEKALLLKKNKESAFFTCTFSDGSLRVGFLSPLMGFSKESFSEALNQLCMCLDSKLPLGALCRKKNLFPSVHFFLQMLEDQIKLASLKKEVHSAYLLFDVSFNAIEKGYQAGNRTFKLKLNQFPESKILAFLNQVTANWKDIKLRLDFNQSSLSLDILKKLPWHAIDYVEEPGSHLQQLMQLFPNQVALDETFRKDPGSFINFPAVFVIKPLLLSHYHYWIRKLKRLKKRVIISSSFEPKVGIDYLSQLTHYYKLNDIHGLDTLKYYDQLPAVSSSSNFSS
jgi:O-succinylbenzoate synthase